MSEATALPTEPQPQSNVDFMLMCFLMGNSCGTFISEGQRSNPVMGNFEENPFSYLYWGDENKRKIVGVAQRMDI